MYAVLDNDTNLGPKVEPPKLWTDRDEVEGWVGKRVKEVLGKDVGPDVDLFHLGMDRSVNDLIIFLLEC